MSMSVSHSPIGEIWGEEDCEINIRWATGELHKIEERGSNNLRFLREQFCIQAKLSLDSQERNLGAESGGVP